MTNPKSNNRYPSVDGVNQMQDVQCSRSKTQRRELAFTLVELLVVIAIIGILVAMLLPAVQAARESARRSACTNQLKQLGLAVLLHESTHNHLPTGGWGHFWLGDPDRGFGESQPGGWLFNILPYVEEQALYDLPADGDPNTLTTQQLEASRTLSESPVGLFNCPSRRSPVLFPKPSSGPRIAYNALPSVNFLAARSDYAANWGDTFISGLEDLDRPFPSQMPDHPNGYHPKSVEEYFNGVCYLESEVRFSQLTDGTSKTYFGGEKYLNPDDYETGIDFADNENWASGFNNDNHRSCIDPPVADTPGLTLTGFGGSHPSVVMMLMCDGSVHAIPYSIDTVVHRNLGNREDGQVVSLN